MTVIEPVSMIGGNIITIVHNRDNTFQDNLSLTLVVDVDQGKIKKLMDIWKSRGISVMKISETSDTFHMDYMLIGELSGSMLEKFVVSMRSKVKIKKINTEISGGDDDRLSAIVSIDVSSQEDLAVIDGLFKEKAKKSKLVYVRGLSQ